MRKFYIEDSTGFRYGLNGEQDIWLTEPNGLGASFYTSYAEIGGGFFKPVYSDASQGAVTGNITFLTDVYGAYQTFTTWLMKASALFLIYQPTDTEYRAQVKVNFISKSEINRGRWMTVPMSFSLTTPWYAPSPVSLDIVPTPADVMRYSFRYDLARYGASAAGNMTAVVQSTGHIPASFDFTYVGELVNPAITLTGQGSGTVYGRIGIATSLAPGDTLEVSTRYLDSYIRSALQGDLLPYVNLSYDPFPHIPLDEPVVIAITATNTLTGVITLAVNNYYRTV